MQEIVFERLERIDYNRSEAYKSIRANIQFACGLQGPLFYERDRRGRKDDHRHQYGEDVRQSRTEGAVY